MCVRVCVCLCVYCSFNVHMPHCILSNRIKVLDSIEINQQLEAVIGEVWKGLEIFCGRSFRMEIAYVSINLTFSVVQLHVII